MSDITVNIDGASALDQRALQELIVTINPDALEGHGIDGDFGSESLNDLQQLLKEYAPKISGELSIKEATDILVNIEQEQAAQAKLSELSTQPLSEVTFSDLTINKEGASALEQRELQTLIKQIEPEALAKYGIDGDLGAESLRAIQEIAALYAPDMGGEFTVKEAIDAFQTIADEQKHAAMLSDKPLSEVTKEQATYIQEMIHTIDPELMPKHHIDGIVGKGTVADLDEVLPGVMAMRLDDLTITDIINELKDQIEDLPQRYKVENCDNLTVIAREVYGDDIKEYTQQLMESGETKFATEEAARVHAEQMAVTKIAIENGLEKGADAHLILPGQILDIPEAGPLKDVDGTLDWKALDEKVGPGGPCLPCTGGTAPKNVSEIFTQKTGNGIYAEKVQETKLPEPDKPNWPGKIKVDNDCTLLLDPRRTTDERPWYKANGESGMRYPDLKELLDNKLNADDIRITGNCSPDVGGGGSSNDPDNPGASPGGGVMSNSHNSSGPSTSLN